MGDLMVKRQSASDAALEYIRDYYRVPAFKGAKVKFKGIEAVIKGGKGQYLDLAFTDKSMNGPYHPTWEIEYLENGGV
jgi:hypothetical protein